MKKYTVLFVILFIYPFFLLGQSSVEQALTARRAADVSDVNLNAMSLIPRLYAENKLDTIDQVITYVNKNYGLLTTMQLYVFLKQIRERNFTEAISSYSSSNDRISIENPSDTAYYETDIIQHYLVWYAKAFNIKTDVRYPLFERNVYGNYFEFISSLANKELEIPGLSPLEKWLLVFLAHPDHKLFTDLKKDIYNGTRLQRAWLKYDKEESKIFGAGFYGGVGLWSPSGKLSILGNHPSFNAGIAGKSHKNLLFDLNFDLRFLKPASPYIVQVDTALVATNFFSGLNASVGSGYGLQFTRNSELDFLGSVGVEYINSIDADKKAANKYQNDAGQLYSFCPAAGVGYRYYFTNKPSSSGVKSRGFVSLQLKYNWLFYNNGGGTDLHGNAITISLVAGYLAGNTKLFP